MDNICDLCGYIHPYDGSPHSLDGLLKKINQLRNKIISESSSLEHSDFFRDVGEFHKKFDLPRYIRTKPGLLTADVLEFRLKFMDEEIEEFELAHYAGKLEHAADALIDLVYVALGTLHMMGLPGNEIWDNVHKANMVKERATGADDPRSTRPHTFNVVKPEGWKPPDHTACIEQARRDWIYINEQTDDPSVY